MYKTYKIRIHRTVLYFDVLLCYLLERIIKNTLNHFCVRGRAGGRTGERTNERVAAYD